MRRKLCRVQFEINTYECQYLNAVLRHELEIKFQRHLYVGCYMRASILRVSCLSFQSTEIKTIKSMEPPPKPNTYSSIQVLTFEPFEPLKGLEMSILSWQTGPTKDVLPSGEAVGCQNHHPCTYWLMSWIAPKTLLPIFNRKQEAQNYLLLVKHNPHQLPFFAVFCFPICFYMYSKVKSSVNNCSLSTYGWPTFQNW